jgi:hypothetical protein
MILTLERISGGPTSTIGLLFVDGRFACFSCEDEHREAKVVGETRIPAGRYTIRLRNWGGFDARYGQRFPFHKGMIELHDVPGFTDILIHIGNTEKDTAGCILVGATATRFETGGGEIGNSAVAYTTLYPVIAAALDRGEPVEIEIVDRDFE